MSRGVEKVLEPCATAAFLLSLSVGVAVADDGTDLVIGLVTIATLLYLIPTWIAFIRRHPNRWPIAVINIALGGTGLGWLGSLVWAMSAVHRSPMGNHGGESGLNLFVNDARQPVVPSVKAAMSSSEDPTMRLVRLKKLRDEGAIDDNEYADLRKPLIDQLRRR